MRIFRVWLAVYFLAGAAEQAPPKAAAKIEPARGTGAETSAPGANAAEKVQLQRLRNELSAKMNEHTSLAAQVNAAAAQQEQISRRILSLIRDIERRECERGEELSDQTLVCTKPKTVAK